MDLCDEDDETSFTSDWVKAVDRGGLVHVSKNTFLLFQRMETIIRSMYNCETMEAITEGVKQRLYDTVVADDDVNFYWSLLTVEIEDAEGAVLLKMIIDLFSTIRGFSFAKSVMEMYKQEHKKCTQKSKFLRKKLPTS